MGLSWLVPYGVSGSWNLILNSVFSGTSLPAPWTTGWFGSGVTNPVTSQEVQCYDPSQVTVSGGMLNLAAIADPETCGGVTRPFRSGIITTDGNFSFTYGYMEAMIWLPATSSGGIADWPAWWADGQNWPTTGEIDTLEGLGGGACWHFHWVGGGPGGCASSSYAGGWHVFGADWEPGSVTYYYDGVEVGQITQGITSAPMYLILNLALNSGDSPATMHVAYARVWQH